MSAELTKPLIVSMVGPLMNKIKCAIKYARKNIKFGDVITPTIELLGEQLIPFYCASHCDNFDEINTMHNLVFLLALKTQQVFTSRIIHTAIDQNWDLKGMKQVLMRIFKVLGVHGVETLSQMFESQAKNQNLQSSSCIKAIGSFIRNPKKAISEDDLSNSIGTYETEFTFIKEDIEKYRSQRIKHECFSVLHPWAYDLDQVDFKYIMNNDLTKKICNHLRTQNSQAFWLAFFKCQASVSADDFFGAIRELCQINKIPEFFSASLPSFQNAAFQADYVFTLASHAEYIAVTVQQVVDAGSTAGFNALRDQIKSYQNEFKGSDLISGLPSGFKTDAHPKLACFSSDKDLNQIRLRELSPAELNMDVDLQRKPFDCPPNQAAGHKLHLNFEAVDTEEIKNLSISFDGNLGIFKIGEGEANHYQIPNDKKLWESQLMVVCKDGKYFIRDLGVVHTSRIKIDKSSEIQIQEDTLVDLGKVVHYHFDKVTHKQKPSVSASSTFQILRPSGVNDYVVEGGDHESSDPPTLRARPTWVSSDENKDLIQKEIILEAYSQNFFSIGRSMKREVQIKLKAVSADHCNLSYGAEKGWTISEKGKDKLSSNGTFVFMKSHGQMVDHEPSDMIPLYDGMVISFINYEIRVNLEKKDADQVSKEDAIIQEANATISKHSQPLMTGTMKAETAAVIQEEPKQTQKHEIKDSKDSDAPVVTKKEELKVVVEEQKQSVADLRVSKEDDKHTQPVKAPEVEHERERTPERHDERSMQGSPVNASRDEDFKEFNAPVIEAQKADSPRKEEHHEAVVHAKAPKAEVQAVLPETEEHHQAEILAEAPKAQEQAELPKVEHVEAAVHVEAPKAQVHAEPPKKEEHHEAVTHVEAPKAKAEVQAELPEIEEKATVHLEAPKAEVHAESPKKEEHHEAPKTAEVRDESPKKEEHHEAVVHVEEPKSKAEVQAELPEREEEAIVHVEAKAAVHAESSEKVEHQEAPKAEVHSESPKKEENDEASKTEVQAESPKKEEQHEAAVHVESPEAKAQVQAELPEEDHVEAVVNVEAPKAELHVESPKKEEHHEAPKAEVHVESPKKEEHHEAPKAEVHVESPKKEEHHEVPKPEVHAESPKQEEHHEAPKAEVHVESPKKEEHHAAAAHVEVPKAEVHAVAQAVIAAKEDNKVEQEDEDRYI